MSWTLIRLNQHATGSTLFVRSGSVLFFAAYSEWQNKWFHLHNGTESECEFPPEYWWTDDPADDPVDKVSVITEKQGQLTFF